MGTHAHAGTLSRCHCRLWMGCAEPEEGRPLRGKIQWSDPVICVPCHGAPGDRKTFLLLSSAAATGRTELWGTQFKGGKPHATSHSLHLPSPWEVRSTYRRGEIRLRDHAKRHPQPKGTYLLPGITGTVCGTTESPAGIPHIVPSSLLTAPFAFPPKPAPDSSLFRKKWVFFCPPLTMRENGQP